MTHAPIELVAPQSAAIRRRTHPGRDSRSVLLLLSPAIAILGIFFGVPIIDLVVTSLSSWSGVGDRTFVGATNYVNLLGDSTAWSALTRSVTLGLGTAIGISIIATLLAALVSGGIAGSNIYRIVWFLPAIAPPSAVAVFWALSVQPKSGVVNAVLGAVGLGDDHAWLADPSTALGVVIAVAMWQGAGFAFLIILGAMEEVPVSTYEAAAIDGAGPIRQFFSITLPLVRPVLAMILLLESIWAFNGFTLAWGMTQGGPGDATTILPVQVYKDAFQSGNFGTAAAISVVGGVILLAVGFVGHWLGSRTAVDA
ncbi:MAG: carbohydrate ABC transporter permease [Leifsonia sp.]|jgi:ABC-type sugar transport system permease subunit